MGIIRVVLALCVLVWHSPVKTGDYLPLHGSYAVQAFFVISGFYMALILTEKYKDRIRLFFENRILRLLPLYLAVVVLQFIIHIVTRSDHAWLSHTQLLNPLTMFLLIVSNLTLIGQDWLMFMGIDIQSGLLYFTSNFYVEPLPAYKFLLVPQAWTVGLELMFYAVAPWLVGLRGRWLVLVMLASLSVRFGLAGIGLGVDPWSYRFFPSELVFFVVGIVAYRVYCEMRDRKITPPTWSGWALAAGLVGYFVMAYYLPVLHNRVVPVMLVALLVPIIFTVTKRNRIDRYIGELSYAIYITHIMAISILRAVSPNYVPSLWVIVFTVPLAMLLQYAVERPVNVIRQRRTIGLEIGSKNETHITTKPNRAYVSSITVE